MITLLLGRLCGLQPPLLLISPFPTLPFELRAICNLNSVGLFLTLKQASPILLSLNGSSVTNKTRSLETLANTSKSVNNNAQDGCKRPRPSTFARAPPNSLQDIVVIDIFNIN